MSRFYIIIFIRNSVLKYCRNLQAYYKYADQEDARKFIVEKVKFTSISEDIN